MKLYSFILVMLAGSISQDTQLSEELKLRATIQQQAEQIQQLQIATATCQANLADTNAKLASSFLTGQAADLKSKREALEKDLLKALGGKEGDSIDWTTNPPSLHKADAK